MIRTYKMIGQRIPEGAGIPAGAYCMACLDAIDGSIDYDCGRVFLPIVEGQDFACRECNARPIDAAPELRDVAEDALVQIEYLRSVLSAKARQDTTPSTQDVLARLRAAIAKGGGTT